MSAPLLEIRKLSHAYRNNKALTELSLSLNRGEAIGLLGPNGSGKTTALQALAGLIACPPHTIFLEGDAAEKLGHTFRRRIGVVFQRPAVDVKLTVRENLWLALRLYGIRGAAHSRRMNELLEQFGLGEHAEQQARTLSGGMIRRLDIARAIAHQPDLLLLDEPTVGLDEYSSRELWRRLRALLDQRAIGILLATHKADEAEYCEQLYFLRYGRVVTHGTPEDLRRNVGHDVLILRTEHPEIVGQWIEKELSLVVSRDRKVLRVESSAGHELIPRLVEHFAQGTFESIELRRPSLADVFFKLTGEHIQSTDYENAA